MCRFTLYLGNETSLCSLITEPEHSLIKQSFNSKERIEPLNGDGFGVGWYIDNDPNPARFRDTTPAWNNYNLFDLSRATKSRCILAHIRAATQGFSVTKTNCHPFKFNNFLMAHNGNISNFSKIKRHLLNRLDDELFNQISGNTDSEHFFALYSQIFKDNYNANKSKLENMTETLNTALAELTQLAEQYTPDRRVSLNCAITDGKQAVISRFRTIQTENPDSLYLCKGEKYQCKHGISDMQKANDKNYHSILVSSEPLSKANNWEEVPANHILSIDEKLNTVYYPINL